MATSGYCTNIFYRQKMCTNCKNECADAKPPCIVPNKDLSCNDDIDDCMSLVFFCNFDNYEPIMLKNCRSTCGNCSGSKKSTTVEVTIKSTDEPPISSTKEIPESKPNTQ